MAICGSQAAVGMDKDARKSLKSKFCQQHGNIRIDVLYYIHPCRMNIVQQLYIIIIIIIGAASQDHMHMSSSKHGNMLPNATGRPHKITQGRFQHPESKFAIRLAV